MSAQQWFFAITTGTAAALIAGVLLMALERGVGLAGCAVPQAPLRPQEHIPPSFDCQEHQSPIETLLCSDNDLATMDNEMADLYVHLRELLPKEEFAPVRDAQRSFLKRREACATSIDRRACVLPLYGTRIPQLEVAYEAALQAPR
ncbi:MAG: DUF1311 domain-containing protein [Alphaproteobacteria bacterium]|nr:DUF1311 domain-containing protein [Alphaproteobacteria bacterium]